jgi:asparagine synthase (glutamine-hydrolysing)
MHGAMAVRVGPSSPGDHGLLDGLATSMRWHKGDPQSFSDGLLEVHIAADAEAGPFLESSGATTRIVHGHPPAPVDTLQSTAHRFTALEWDGTVLRVTRDAFGLVPLFYRLIHGAVWLATEAGALLTLGAADPDLEALVAQAADVRLVSRTGWSGIHRVIPGTTLQIDGDLRISARRWWRPESHFATFHGSRAQAAQRFAGTFGDAVGSCMAPGMGILASGGLDSSAVTAMSVRRGTTPRLFHVVYPSLPHSDELAYAEAVAEHANVPLHKLDGDLSPWEPWSEIANFRLPLETVPIGMFEVGLQALRDGGGEVMLDGHDGDGIMGETPQSLRGQLALHAKFTTLARLATREGTQTMLRGMAANLVPPQFRLRRLRGRPTQAQLTGFGYYFCGDTLARINAIHPWRFPPSAWRIGEFAAVMPPFTLVFEEFEMIAAGSGIDIRHPFTHPRLVREMLGLPFTVKVDPLRTKVILRDGLDGLLPPLVSGRPGKSSFDGVLERRVDLGACMKIIEESGVEIPGVDYRRLRDDAYHHPEFIEGHPAVVIALTRIHAFAAAA